MRQTNLPEANERALSALSSQNAKASDAGRRSPPKRASGGAPAAWPSLGPCSRLGPAGHNHSRLCRVVAVQAHGEAALPAGALHGLPFCCLTFELRRPTRRGALARHWTICAADRCRAKAARLVGSPLERGVRPHGRTKVLSVQVAQAPARPAKGRHFVTARLRR